jgi:dipeptidase
MASDMVVALARATGDGHTLFGHNSNRPRGEGQALRRVAGRPFEAGEVVRTPTVTLPQVRHTTTVLATQAAGQWGYAHGVNEHRVAIGTTPIRSKLDRGQAGLAGPDLVRLALERATSARQAVDVVTDLVCRHGQGSADDEGASQDNAFLIADPQEAFAVAACGHHWTVQAVGAVRALGEACHIRKDWDRISRGLADLAIEHGWWPGDGSKLDFAGAVCADGPGAAAALRRWGRATLLLEQQSGQIDVPFLRRLLADHFEGCADEVDPCDPAGASLCRHAGAEETATAASLVAQLGPAPVLPVAWCTFGPPCVSVFFPLFLEGEIPEAFGGESGVADSVVSRRLRGLAARATRDRHQLATVRDTVAQLQTRIDQEARELLGEATLLQRRGETEGLRRLTGSFMQHQLECFEDAWSALMDPKDSRRAVATTAW